MHARQVQRRQLGRTPCVGRGSLNSDDSALVAPTCGVVFIEDDGGGAGAKPKKPSVQSEMVVTLD
jgi:hypothetical protein